MEKLIYSSPAHEKFYNEQLTKVRSTDRYHRALIYTLGITEDTRNHFNEIYNISEDRIITKSISSAWVTGTDVRIMRLAFNLFTDGIPEEDPDKALLYTVARIFDYNYQHCLLQAIAIRYL